jgi:hypothetical protein
MTRFAGISWLHGDTLALTVSGENKIAYANVGRASSRLDLSYKPLIGSISTLWPDKITYNSEARMLMVTDLESASSSLTSSSGGEKRRPVISLVMLNGVVRPTTDGNFESAAGMSDVYYATGPRKLFVLSSAENKVLEIAGDGNIAAQLSLDDFSKNPISFTFSPEGRKLIVLEADGSMHILSSELCPGTAESGGNPAAAVAQQQQEQFARLGRKVLGAPKPMIRKISPIINIAGERSDSWVDDVRQQVGASSS